MQSAYLQQSDVNSGSAPVGRTESTSILVHLWVHSPDTNGLKSQPEAVFNYDLFPNGQAKPGDLVEVTTFTEATENSHVHVTSTVEEGVDSSEVGGNGTRSGISGRTSIWNNNLVEDTKRKRFLFVIREWTAEEKQKQPHLQVEKALYEASHVELLFKDQYIARSDMWRLAAQELTDNCIYNSRKINFIGSIKAQVTGVWIRGQKVDAAYFSSRTRPIFRSASARYVLFVQMSKEMWHFETEGNGEILFNKMINGFLPELFKRWRRADSHHLVSIVLFTRIFYDKDAPQGFMNEGEELTAIVREGREYTYRDFFRVVVSNKASDDWTIILHQLKKEFTVFLKDVLVQYMTAPTSKESETKPAPFTTSLLESPSTTTQSDPLNLIIAGEPSSSVHGNVLEAIAMACSQFSHDHIDRDLVRTGISIIIVSPGTGQFVVDQSMLQITTDNLIANGIGIDLVCLARPPLHSVPLFRYLSDKSTSAPGPDTMRSRSGTTADASSPALMRAFPNKEKDHSEMVSLAKSIANPHISAFDVTKNTTLTDTAVAEDESEWVYAIPHWIDISFWSTSSERKSRHHREQAAVQSRASNVTDSSRKFQKSKTSFMARCKMYEIQMTGLMENEVVSVSSISIPYIQESPLYAPLPITTKPDRLPGQSSEQPSSAKDSLPRSVLSESAKERFVAEEKLVLKFMSEYDDTAFKSLPELEQTLQTAENKRQQENEKRLEKVVKEDSIYIGSFRSNRSGRSEIGTGGLAFLDRKMRERRPSLEPPTDHVEKIRQTSRTRSIAASSSTSKPVSLTRHISFGIRGTLIPAKATASSALSLGTETILTRGFKPASVTAETSLTATSGIATRETTNRPRKSSIGSVASSSSHQHTERSDGISGSAWNGRPVSRPIAIKGMAKESDTLNESKPIYVDKSQKATAPNGMMSPKMIRRSSLLPREGKSDLGSEREKIDIFTSASQARLAVPKLDLAQGSGQMIATPTTLTPSTAMLPWLTILNPSNPKASPLNPKNQFGRWQHVFPRPLRVATIKWKSLCSPAALPLTTEYFPTVEQLLSEYEESPYVIAQNDDDDVEEISRNRKELVREMVSQRLARGFQIVVGTSVQEFNINRIGEPDIFAMSYMTKAGSSIFMSMGPHIHQLICDEEFNVEVKRYTRKPTSLNKTIAGLPPLKYTAYVRTVSSGAYAPRSTVFRIPTADYNWNYIDRYLGGYEEDFTEQMRFWRARFVLIPIDPQTAGQKRAAPGAGPSEELNDEENRLEGIKKITQLFQRNRYVPPEERRYQRNRTKVKDLNPLEIIFQTDDPSVLVARELEPLSLLENENTSRRVQLFTGPEMFDRASMRLPQLAQELQGPRGIRLQDRRWHLRLHYNCFIGSELVTWMLENFKDIEDRDEGVKYGEQLMKDGLFQHVEGRHKFRDGNFFYQLQSDYSIPRPASRGGWFGGRSKASVSETNDATITERVTRSRSNSNATEDSGNVTGLKSHSSHKKQRTKIELSKVMRYNLDSNNSNKRSYRPEIINLHYDRLHNPDNCYHIRIEWLNVTSKLVDDALTAWARTIYRYGLKLVEAPIDETWSIANANPFRALTTVSLALPPPKPFLKHENTNMPTSFTPLHPSDPLLYHKAILKSFSFVLDLEAATNFPADANVIYSWGKPNYKYSQYIHRSGVLFAQITDEGDFLLLANRLYTSRTGGNDRNDNNVADRGPNTTTAYRGGHSTSSLSAVQSYSISGLINSNGPASTSYISGDAYLTAEMIKDDIKNFCKDVDKLQIFYDEITTLSMNPMTPQVAPISIRSSGLMRPIGSTPASPAMIPLGASAFTPSNLNVVLRDRLTSMSEKISIEGSSEATSSD